MGIIQRSSSPYINPIVPVIKKDGTVTLYFSDPNRTYYLEDTDASNYALGAILYQKNEKQEK